MLVARRIDRRGAPGVRVRYIAEAGPSCAAPRGHQCPRYVTRRINPAWEPHCWGVVLVARRLIADILRVRTLTAMPIISSHPLTTGCPPAWASAWGQDQYGPWVTLCVDKVEQRLRWMPPGRFWMGSPDDDREAFDREKPRHQVRLTRGFWLFDTPCTQALWQAVVGQNPSRFEGVNRPVERVSWEDCQEFMGKLNKHFSGLDLRLPTEAEWEYACRAGTETPRYSTKLAEIAWYDKNSE